MNTNTIELNLNDMETVNGGKMSRAEQGECRMATGALIGAVGLGFAAGCTGGPVGVIIGGLAGGAIGGICGIIYDSYVD